MRRSDKNAPNNREEEIRSIKNTIRIFRESFEDGLGFTDSDVSDMLYKKPEVIFDNDIVGIASATHDGTLISINTKKLLEYIKFAKGICQTENIKIRNDILILKIIFHELMHLRGSVDMSSTGYSPINEAITEMLSFTIMVEYLNSNGNGYVQEVSKLFHSGLHGIYEYEKILTAKFIGFLIKVNESNNRLICDAFYRAYLRRESLASDKFLFELPEEIRALWKRFLSLESSINNEDNHIQQAEEMIKELEARIEKIK